MNNKSVSWYDRCEFIETWMAFYSWEDFKENKVKLKKYYSQLDWRSCHLYQYYVYAKTYLTERQKNIIWNYLNDVVE